MIQEEIVVGSKVLMHPYWIVGTVKAIEKTNIGIPLAIIDFLLMKDTRWFTDDYTNIVPFGIKYVIRNKQGDVMHQSVISHDYCIRRYNRDHTIPFNLRKRFSGYTITKETYDDQEFKEIKIEHFSFFI